MQLLLMIPGLFLGILAFYPEAFGSEVARLIPTPLDTFLEIVTILLIISPLLDWANKPRMRLLPNDRQLDPKHFERLFQLVNIGNKSAEGVEVRLGFGNYFQEDVVLLLLSGGTLRPTPGRGGPFKGFEFTLHFNDDSDKIRVTWGDEKKDGHNISRVPQSESVGLYDVVTVWIAWGFAGRENAVERRFEVNYHPSVDRPRLREMKSNEV